jgi:hypothetical protein
MLPVIISLIYFKLFVKFVILIIFYWNLMGFADFCQKHATIEMIIFENTISIWTLGYVFSK